MSTIEPAVTKMENYTGRGGNLNATQFRKKFDESELDEE